jgi:hypothetical protein
MRFDMQWAIISVFLGVRFEPVLLVKMFFLYYNQYGSALLHGSPDLLHVFPNLITTPTW